MNLAPQITCWNQDLDRKLSSFQSKAKAFHGDRTPIRSSKAQIVPSLISFKYLSQLGSIYAQLDPRFKYMNSISVSGHVEYFHSCGYSVVIQEKKFYFGSFT